jgi:hypothetical protein
MLKFILSTLFTAALLPIFLAWSREQTEGQIDKMQEAAFNTPGMASPVTPPMLAGGIGLAVGHFTVGGWLGQKGWQTFLSLLAGLGVGTALFFQLGKQED